LKKIEAAYKTIRNFRNELDIVVDDMTVAYNKQVRKERRESIVIWLTTLGLIATLIGIIVAAC